MKDLLKKTETGEFEDDGWLLLQNVHWFNDGLELVVDLDDGVEGSPNTTWVINAQCIHEYRLVDARCSGLSHHKEGHVIIKQYTDNTANLFFRGTHSAPTSVLGALLEAHNACVQDWIDFGKYINTEQKLSDLMSAGFGKLASGPKFLLKEYQAVLESFDIRANITDEMPVKRWNGKSWVDFLSVPEMIHLGGSYVVADSFHARKQSLA